MTQQHVQIGREFFAKIRDDYADWRWALVREFLQNCFDAPGCRNVTVIVAGGPTATLLTVANDGAPMDRATLTTKLLTLGGSGKNFDGENTGGFGVAKSLLYYCHLNYQITTGNLAVSGNGGQYTIEEMGLPFAGTTSTVTVEGDEADALTEKVRRFASLAQWKGRLTLNGEHLATDLHKGARRKDVGFGVVYTNNSHQNLCVVRLNGQPMFTTYTRHKGCVLVELTGRANATLTSNRDGLRSPFASQLSDLLTALAVDKRSALREQRAEYKRYAGERLKNEAKQPKAAALSLASIMGSNFVANGPCQLPTPIPGLPAVASQGGIKLVMVSKSDEPDKSITVGPEFILKNATGRKLPVHYVPGEKFSTYCRELIGAWTKVLLKLHQLCNRSGEFSVGFVFDDDNEAECEQTQMYGRVYYLNPVRVATGPKRSMAPRFASAWRDRAQLIALACHEFVHGAYGLGDHDEDYAGTLTEVTAVAMANLPALHDACRTQQTETAPDADLQERYDALVNQLARMEQELKTKEQE